MRWLDGCTVLLDPNAEASADYLACEQAPPPPGFGLARPYVAAAQALQQAAADDGDCGEAREDGAAPGAADEPRRRRKKRRRRESDNAAALRAQRGDEAERRHLEVLPLLEAALALYATHLRDGEQAAAEERPPVSPRHDAAALPALVDAAEGGEPLQLALRIADADAWHAAPLAGHVHANDSDRCGLAAVVASQPALRFVLPPRCRFALSSAARLRCCTPQLRGGGGFRLLIADPPWECASVARSKAYATLDCGQIRALPMRQLCHPAGALVALWVTNRERIRRYVEQELLPAWGMELVAEWLWLKVAADGSPALPLRGGGAGCRRPYEPLLLLRSAAADASAMPPVPHRAVVLAPPGAHSRKPRLLRLLLPFAPRNDDCGAGGHTLSRPNALDACELFARELCADATAWGNEPLRFQAL